MKRHGTFVSLLHAQQKRFAAVSSDTHRTMRELALEGWRDHLRLTGGSISSEQLAQMGHPYGRGANASMNFTKTGDVARRGAISRGVYMTKNGTVRRRGARGRAPLRPINVQSGELRSSIHLAMFKRGVFDVHIGRGVDYAKYILHPAGTRYMVGRGVMGWREVNKAFPIGQIERLHRTRVKAVRQAIKSGFSKN